MRRWNGWGDTLTTYPVAEPARLWLEDLLGELQRPEDISFKDAAALVPGSTLKHSSLVVSDSEDRLCHVRGQSLPDWVDIRTGRITRFPEGVAYPEGEEDLLRLYQYAKENGVVLIPYGGGTSVVGGINPEPDGPSTLTVDLQHMSHFQHFDEQSHLATFGAGIKGPYLEAALHAKGYLLGHYPQSFELSTLGGWIVTRSSGQQSLHYGRIEQTFAGGRLVTPEGTIDMPPFPASAAGPDLREMVLGSEGRMGIVSRATVRVSPLPQKEEFRAVFFPTWKNGVDAVREIIQAGIPLSMLRMSNAAETEANLVLAGHERLVALAHTGLQLIGQKRDQKCMLLFGATGRSSLVRIARSEALSIARKHGGFHAGQYMGKTWEKSRFRSPYLRNTLWEEGVAIDTLETALPWSMIEETEENILSAIQKAGERFNERVFVFAHLSHLYPTGASLYVTILFRVLPDPDQMLEMWQAMKCAASDVIVKAGGTISHQHGVGVDHAAYLPAEKGELGIQLIENNLKQCDPSGLLNPGKLIRKETAKP